MKIKRLSLKNIRSYKEEEIVFPEGSILLAGDIGSGKTSILLALEYSLFGLQPGQRGASLLRNGANSGEVKLELEIGERKVIIERKLKRNHKSVTNEYASVMIDNEKIEASLTEIKIKILELIGYPQEFIKRNNLLYRYTVYTPQENMKQILLEDAETRINVLRHILGVDKYKKIRENLSILLNQLKEESKILQGEVKNLDEEKAKLEIRKEYIQTLEQNIKLKLEELDSKINYRKKIELEFLDLEERIKERIYLEKEVEKTKIMLANKHENAAGIQREISDLEKAIAEEIEIFQETDYKDLIKKIEDKNDILDYLNSCYTNTLSEIGSLEKQRQETITKRDRVFKIEICPTCLQDVLESHKHNILNETESVLGKAKQRMNSLEKEIVIISREIEKTKTEKKILEEHKTNKEILKTKLLYLDKAKSRHSSLLKNREVLEKDIILLDRHIQILKEKISNLSKFDNLMRLKKEELNQALLEERKFDISLAETKKELDLIKLEIINSEQFISLKEKAKKNLIYLLELHDWLSISFLELIEFIERNVLLKLRHEFSAVFSKWFNMLVPPGALTVRLDESFSPIILHKDAEMDYSFLSGGERTAIALAYRLALNQTINSMLSKIKTKDIVILDEPTDGFSEVQLDKMHEVLQELNVSQLIIVSHERKIENFVDNVIRIRKLGDISFLEPTNKLSMFIPEANHKT